MQSKMFWTLFFLAPDVPGVRFIIHERAEDWIQTFGWQNFIAAVPASGYEEAVSVAHVLHKFLDSHIVHTELCRAIKGPPGELEDFILLRLQDIVQRPKKDKETPKEFLDRAQKEMITQEVGFTDQA